MGRLFRRRRRRSRATSPGANRFTAEVLEGRVLLAVVNAVSNGGFEDNFTNWNAAGDVMAATNAAKANSGTRYAVGGVDTAGQVKNNAYGTLIQSVLIDPAAVSAEARFAYSISTLEPAAAGAVDTLSVTFRAGSAVKRMGTSLR